MYFFFDLQSVLLALLVCHVCTHFCVFKMDMDDSTKQFSCREGMRSHKTVSIGTPVACYKLLW